MANSLTTRRNTWTPERLFKDFWGNNWMDGFFGGWDETHCGIRADIKETETAYVVEAELPGFKKDEIAVDLNNDVLTITAEHKTESETKNENYVRRERTWGSYKRSFIVDGIDKEKVGAEYKDGILALTLPKQEKVQAAKKSIDIQ